jgi:transcriptional regulator
MYIPTAFAETRPERLHALLAEHPLGCIVTQGDEGLDANHLPFEFHASNDGTPGVLRAHIARANSLLDTARRGADVLVVFRGKTAYVSPNWYPSKHETHRMVPTWNYEVVHAHGRLGLVDDERFLRGVLARLTRTHEAGQPKPWKMGDAPPDYVQQMVAMIAGIEVRLTRLEGKFKLSQNRSERDVQGVVKGLEQQGDAAMAGAVAAALKEKTITP